MYEQVIVIGHEAVGQDFSSAGVDEVAANEAEEVEVVVSAEEDVLTIDAPIVEVVALAGGEGEFAARHGTWAEGRIFRVPLMELKTPGVLETPGVWLS